MNQAYAQKSTPLPPAPDLRSGTSCEDDFLFMPTYDQVERSMARALRFQQCCPHQREIEAQIIEGRKMAQQEGRSTGHLPVSERDAQGPAPFKRPRKRNRNRNRQPMAPAFA